METLNAFFSKRLFTARQPRFLKIYWSKSAHIWTQCSWHVSLLKYSYWIRIFFFFFYRRSWFSKSWLMWRHLFKTWYSTSIYISICMCVFEKKIFFFCTLFINKQYVKTLSPNSFSKSFKKIPKKSYFFELLGWCPPLR